MAAKQTATCALTGAVREQHQANRQKDSNAHWRCILLSAAVWQCRDSIIQVFKLQYLLGFLTSMLA